RFHGDRTEVTERRFWAHRDRRALERKGCGCRSCGRYYLADCPQTYRSTGSLRRRLRLPDPLSAHAPGICRATRQKWQSACQGEFFDYREPEALAGAVPDSAGHGQAERRAIKTKEDKAMKGIMIHC